MTARNPIKRMRDRPTVRRQLFSLSPGLIVAFLAGCHGSVSAPKAPTAPSQTEAAKSAGAEVSGAGPKIALEKDVCDLGEIGVDTKHEGQFKFTNTGAAPLKIVQVRTLLRGRGQGRGDGPRVAPGAGGTLDFTFQAPSIPSPAVVRLVSLQTNDPKHGTTPLTLKASVVRRVDCSPKSLTLALRGPNVGCPDLVLTSLNHRPFSITDFKASLGAITAPFDPGVKATEFTLKPQVDLARLQQQRSGRISITLTHPECTNVQVQYVVVPEFAISPPNLVLFGLQAGQPAAREFRIRNNYQEDFEIESVASQKGTITLLEKSKMDGGFCLRVQITPPVPEGQKPNLVDVLQVKIKDGQTLLIPCRGFYPEQ